ncbi:MAG: DUF4159 domain-containing protein [Chloroherpetonaceae bacterium]|nr:DUF4159 domain-containing protein [Chloroherpetonaceae bacterium]MDW8437030.1 DUF4159 domain-containing protein [Chloroherpetonaceae bacterium]
MWKGLALLVAFAALNETTLLGQKLPPAFRCARLKYSGGGDWYNDPTAVPNLMRFIREHTGVATPDKEEIVEASSPNIFQYRFVFMTGHGNVRFTDAELDNLRAYLKAGGFIYVDDDYGMDKSFRREVKRLFSGTDLVELPHSHPIFNIFFRFPNGAPKIHEHDGQPPQTFGLFYDNRLVLLYTYECNPSDGWANPEIHNDPPEKREEALRFGTNIVLYAITH